MAHFSQSPVQKNFAMHEVKGVIGKTTIQEHYYSNLCD